jgi:hypothetical protein
MEVLYGESTQKKETGPYAAPVLRRKKFSLSYARRPDWAGPSLRDATLYGVKALSPSPLAYSPNSLYSLYRTLDDAAPPAGAPDGLHLPCAPGGGLQAGRDLRRAGPDEHRATPPRGAAPPPGPCAQGLAGVPEQPGSDFRHTHP